MKARYGYIHAAVLTCLLTGWSGLGAQDEPPVDPPESPWLHGAARLARPDPAVDEDASGFAVVLQHGERQALHVHVRRLDPGAAYEVTGTLGEATEVIGTITTRGAGPDKPPRLYYSRLSGAREVPPVETDGRGFGSFILNRERTELSYRIFARGLSGPLTGAHIHRGAAGEEGDVLLPLDHETLKGTLPVTAEQVELLASGGTYVNLHTEKNPEGEIRGQVKPILFSPWLHRIRAGSGSLKLDTSRGDKLPFAPASIADLKGMVLSVLNAEKKVVLSGTLAEIATRGEDNEEGGEAGGGAALADEEGNEQDVFFALDEEHDASFIRGDANDDGRFDISDPVVVLSHLFQGGHSPYCGDAADANDDGRVEISDPIAMLASLFQAYGQLPGPFPSRGFDATADGLFCED